MAYTHQSPSCLSYPAFIFRESEKLEIADESNRENQVYGAGTAKFGVNDMNVMYDEDNNSQGLKVEELRAVIIMNAHCIIQVWGGCAIQRSGGAGQTRGWGRWGNPGTQGERSSAPPSS